MATVRIQVIKVYDVEVPGRGEQAISEAYGLQTTEIEANGRFVDASTDFAEVVDGDDEDCDEDCDEELAIAIEDAFEEFIGNDDFTLRWDGQWTVVTPDGDYQALEIGGEGSVNGWKFIPHLTTG